MGAFFFGGYDKDLYHPIVSAKTKYSMN